MQTGSGLMAAIGLAAGIAAPMGTSSRKRPGVYSAFADVERRMRKQRTGPGKWRGDGFDLERIQRARDRREFRAARVLGTGRWIPEAAQ